MESTILVWDCTKCGAVRTAGCGSVCLPAERVRREDLRQVVTRSQTSKQAWVDYAAVLGWDPAEAAAIPKDELIAALTTGGAA